MKNVLKAIGTAILFFLLYIGVQLIVTMVFGITSMVGYMAKNAGNIDYSSMASKITKGISSYTVYILSISDIIVVFVLFVVYKAIKKKLLINADIRKIKINKLMFPALLGISLYILIVMGLNLLPIPENLMNQYSSASGNLANSGIILQILVIAVIAPITEEVLYRGLMMMRLRRCMPAIPAAIISSPLFALAHGSFLWMAYAFVLGITLCFVCIKYRSILASLAVHIVSCTGFDGHLATLV